MRLIDADRLKAYWLPDHDRKFEADYFIHSIDAQPSAEPQIIRCKDCKFNIEKDDCFCILWNHAVYKDDFCSHAGKMEVENETD